VALGPEEGFLRFCSASMATPKEGMDSYVFFTGEETSHTVNGVQRGFAVALDTDTGEHTAVPGTGRLNHENTVLVPGRWDQLAMLTTDDTFSAGTSQLYMYLADDPIGESSGIVDASKRFGKGTWLVTVQGHGTNVTEDSTLDPENLVKRESGQLLLMKIPGSQLPPSCRHRRRPSVSPRTASEPSGSGPVRVFSSPGNAVRSGDACWWRPVCCARLGHDQRVPTAAGGEPRRDRSANPAGGRRARH